MNHTRLTARSVLAVVMAAALPKIMGQAVENAPASATDSDQEIVMSPFYVESSEDHGYQATQTLAGTRIKTELKDVGSAISVVTKEFLRDTGARKTEDLLVYTTNTEVGGISGNFAGGGNSATIGLDSARLKPQSNTRVRGLSAADNTRDFFLTDIPWDGYIVDRVDLQRGPNSILFGIGSPAGIVNSSVNSANFKDQDKLEFRYGSYGSARGVLDLNKVLLKGELAARFVALDDNTQYRQRPAFNHDIRQFGALRWDPKFLAKNGAHTSLKINFEHGSINANRPRTTPPLDGITPWFNNLGKRTYSAVDAGVKDDLLVPTDRTYGFRGATYRPGGGDNASVTNPNYEPWLDGPAGRIYDGPVAIFADNASSTQNSNFIFGAFTDPMKVGAPTGGLGKLGWITMAGIQPYATYAVKAKLPNANLGVYKNKMLTDSSVFDFYNVLLDGPNKHEEQKFEAWNAALQQTFFGNRVGFDLAVDRQNYTQGQETLLSAGQGDMLLVDVIRTLPDGTTNPNVGRPFVSSDAGGGRYNTKRDAFRATAFGELRFQDFMGKTLLSRLLGRHVFTGLYNTQKEEINNRGWARYASTDAFTPTAGNPINQASRSINVMSYLGGSIASASSPTSLSIPGIQALQTPKTSGNVLFFNSSLKTGVDPATADLNNTANYIGWTPRAISVWNSSLGDEAHLYTSASKSKAITKSQAFIWEGHLLDDVIVPIIGLRKDTQDVYNAGTVPNLGATGEQKNPNDPTWRLPTGADDVGGPTNRTYNSETGRSTSWSVVAHMPKQWKEKMPLRTDISFFYNRSSNFSVDAGRQDVFGHPIAAPQGKTKDYGIVINTLNDKLTLKINWYETTVSNATIDTNAIGASYLLGAGEAWGYGFATWAKKGPTANAYGSPGASAFGPNYNLKADGTLIDPTINPEQGGWLAYEPQNGETVAQAYAHQKAAINAFLANPVPADFAKTWNIKYDTATTDWGNMTSWSQASNIAVTGDTKSKGTEYEIAATPIAGLSIAFNASKTSASRLNIAQSYATWVEQRYAFYKTVAGDVRLWGGSAGTETVRSKFEAEFYGPYTLFRLQENNDVPELRPWRFNLVTNYSFQGHGLKGLNVGGGYRWEDEIVTGYPVKNGTFDLANPYKGPSDSHLDLWAGYERKLTSKLHWRVQLNLRNVLAHKRLIPLTVQPDGSPGAFRIPDLTSWTVTNTFTF